MYEMDGMTDGVSGGIENLSLYNIKYIKNIHGYKKPV